MQFLKKNYEKVLLAVVIVLALGIVACLPILVSGEKQKLDDALAKVIDRPAKPLPPLDLTKVDALIKNAQTSVTLDLNSHHLFNPVRWQRDASGKIFPNRAGTEIDKLEIVKISPLYEIFSLESVEETPGLATHYGIGIKHEAAAMASQRSMKTTYAAMNEKTTNNFTVTAAEPSGDSASVTLELSDTHQSVTISKDKPFMRPEGYIADLRYPPENKNFPNRRKTDTSPIYFAGEAYKIIDIKESEVVLLQQSNQKTWIKELNTTSPASAP
jgi:hypothetical protein